MNETTDPPTGAAVIWRALDDQDAAVALAALVDWVTWLHDRYQLKLGDLPACWARHGAAIEELTALRTSWEAAYDPETGGGRLPALWHQDLEQTLGRLNTRWLRGCTAGECGAVHTVLTPVKGALVAAEPTQPSRRR